MTTFAQQYSSYVIVVFLCFICPEFLVDVAYSFTKNDFASSYPLKAQMCRISNLRLRQPLLFMVGDAQGDYYGESSGSYMVKELSMIEELENIVQLASQPIPERPDGIVVVVKYSSASRDECCATEAEYERFARNNPATIFMRCMEEYENAHLLLEQVDVRTW